MTTLPTIGWIGAGRMGVQMAGFILQAGYPLVVCTRSDASRGKLLAQGARAVASTAECARAADVIFSSLPDDAALREVALGDHGVLANARSGAIYADTSTVSPQIGAEIDRESRRFDIAYLRIPISGNAAQARTGDLTTLVSGPDAAWKAILPVLETFSKAQIYLGPGDEALYMKLVSNLIIVNTAQAMAEALTLGRTAGLDWTLMLDTLANSAIASPWLKAKAGLLKQRDFAATMTTRLILKDIDLMLAAAAANNVSMPITAVTREMMRALIDDGMGDDDYMSVVKLAEQRAGLSSDPSAS